MRQIRILQHYGIWFTGLEDIYSGHHIARHREWL